MYIFSRDKETRKKTFHFLFENILIREINQIQGSLGNTHGFLTVLRKNANLKERIVLNRRKIIVLKEEYQNSIKMIGRKAQPRQKFDDGDIVTIVAEPVKRTRWKGEIVNKDDWVWEWIERVDGNCVLNAAFFREIDFFFRRGRYRFEFETRFRTGYQDNERRDKL